MFVSKLLLIICGSEINQIQNQIIWMQGPTLQASPEMLKNTTIMNITSCG
jgi:hypothetical protein